MIKKEYQKPTVKVVQLRQRHRMLLASEPEELSGHAKTGSESSDTWYELQ